MPTTTVHPAHLTSFHKQGGMVTTEELLPQHQHRPAYRHPDTPHESYNSPPQTDRRAYCGEPIAHIGFASKDRNRHRLSPTNQRSAISRTDDSSTKLSPHSASPCHSPTGSYGIVGAGGEESSAWSRSSPHNQDPHALSPPNAVAFRPQPRASPVDPSLSSSSSSASPSPSISTITAASTPITTDGITAVTKGTAAASLNDSRPSRHQATGKPTFPKEEPIDRYERPGDLAHSPAGGLVQPAIKPFSSSHRGGSHESDPMALGQQQQQPPRPSSAYGPDLVMSSNSVKLAREDSPDYHMYSKGLAERSSAQHYDTARGPFAAYEQPYQPRPSGNLRPSGAYPPSSTTPTISSFRSRHPDYESRHPSSHYPPLSPRLMVKEEPLTRERSCDWPPGEPHRDHLRLKPSMAETGRHDQGYRDSSYSPPGPYPYDAPPSSSSSHHYPPYYSHHHQHPYPPHPPSHPSLQQQQQPPPLYDPVRESDQRTSQHADGPPVYPPYSELHSPRDGYYRTQRRGYPEAPSPRQANSQQPQQHGLVARPERLTSPGPSHPYHSSRSYHSHSADAAFVSHPSAQHRRAEDDIRLARGPASQPVRSHDQHHHYQPLSPQPHSSRYPGDSTHARTLTHGSPEHGFDGHGSLEGMQGQGLDGGRDMIRAYDGRYDTESQHRMRRRRGDYETISEPQSASLAAATAAAGTTAAPLHREVQRGIRPSVSESDLASVELKRERERRLGSGPLGKDVHGDYHQEYESKERFLDEEEREYRRMHSAATAVAGRRPHHLDDPRQHMSREEYMYTQQQQQHLHHQHYPYHDRQEQCPPQHPSHPHEYDGHYESQGLVQRGREPSHPSSSQRAQGGSSSTSSLEHQRKKQQQQQQEQFQQQQASGEPAGASSSIQAQGQPQRRSSNQIQGNFPLRMLPPLHPRQLPALLPYHTTRPGSTNSSQPKVPMRRGPYLSKQRALLAGYELPSPSSRYQCQYCSKRFSRPSSLRIHTYSHTGERPFKCSEEGCGRQFSVQSNMRRHLRVHRMGRMRSEYSELDQEQEQDLENEQDEQDLE
ncbi:hypothetical protein EC957_008445 [Mortierella hygrophila]|uniref:C2H2-type domain-containing protein n=2 Tax=Mortierellaceae TaxID=4854 RepID=A0A9P6FDA3_9FUNG|nr:hypothetical protein EC957_008445 [Mortierella hygrophila]